LKYYRLAELQAMVKSKEPPSGETTFNKAGLGIAKYQELLGSFIAPPSEEELAAQRLAQEKEDEEERLFVLAPEYLLTF
jgi:hypothetical protein